MKNGIPVTKAQERSISDQAKKQNDKQRKQKN